MVLLGSDPEFGRDDATPDFGLPGTDGETYSFSSSVDYDAVLVVLTYNHCLCAKVGFGGLDHLASAYNDLTVVGINPNNTENRPEDSFERMQELVADGTIGYTAYLHDRSQAVTADYGVVCMSDPFLPESTGGGSELAFHSCIDDTMSPDDETSDYEMRITVETLLAGDGIPVEEYPSQGCSIRWKDE